jgi:hypothetical protein
MAGMQHRTESELQSVAGSDSVELACLLQERALAEIAASRNAEAERLYLEALKRKAV